MNKVQISDFSKKNELRVELFDSGIPAGFPSPAQGYNGDAIDLNTELIRHPASTFCARVSGYSMKDCGIDDGDLLIVDKSLPVRDGDIAVCFLDGEFTLKRISVTGEGLFLVPANEAYRPIRVSEENHFQVWGIVTSVIKKIRK